MRVGLANDGYPEKRCIIGNQNDDFINYNGKNIYKYINFLKGKIFKSAPDFLFKPYAPSAIDDAEIFHFFNHIGLVNKSWVSTFETTIPRIAETMDTHRQADGKNSYHKSKKTNELLTAISKDNCLGIFALSQSAYDIQMAMLEAYPELLEPIREKMQVIHPPQELLTSSLNNKHATDGPVKFIFVGSDFYRKGGAELVLAFSELLSNGDIAADAISVTLVGDISRRGNYVHGDFQDNIEFYEDIEHRLNSLPCITHFSSLPNKTVLENIASSHVGLLPTWGDTYGYSVLEMQASGCPVITTNVRALGEINPPHAGWLIATPINKYREIVITSVEDKNHVRRKMVDGLKTAIINAVNDKQSISEKAQASINRIKAEHDPDTYFKKIKSIYRQNRN
jgi:glycosyltransferase involved in cell wall biosynthesis